MRILRLLDRLRLKNRDFSMLSNNCIATLVYHKYKLRYLSPTINAQISPEHFIKLCKNLEHYLNCDLVEVFDCDDTWFKSIGGEKIDFPVGKLDDIIIYFQHYKSFDEAKESWNKRKLRINADNLFVVLLDVNPSRETIVAFNQLPQKNKLYMYFKGNFNLPNCFRIEELENSEKYWYQDMPRVFFKKKFFEQFDFSKWLNKKNSA